MRKMYKSKDVFLTPSQFTFTLKSAMVGIEIMYIPNSIIKFARQDSWISCILGAVYPLYILLIANYLCKRSYNEDILVLSKKCFGNILGSILNFIFISYFLFMLTSEFSGYIQVFKVYATGFLQNYQMLFTTLIPVTYIVYNGIKPLGRLNEVGFYLTITLLVIPIGILAYGTFLNLMPVFDNSIGNILKGSIQTVFPFSGMEVILFIYPFLKDKKNLLKCGLKAIVIVTFIYTWTVSATIYYLGIEISPKYLWPVLTLADSVHIPIVNSFRFVFIALWSLVQFKCMATYYFSISYSLNQSIKKISPQTFTLLLYPLIIIITSLYGNPTTRKIYTDRITNVYAAFNIIYISTIAILIHFKKDKEVEKA
ncbi:GerAB/ArcD/ProY family transporter [Clostridium kluyveri]|nr:GerAB/ArcD/ProY family transporter [Clostridium kluyveri]UZQ50726.1 spore germination protein [Clostridium kluyveri]